MTHTFLKTCIYTYCTIVVLIGDWSRGTFLPVVRMDVRIGQQKVSKSDTMRTILPSARAVCAPREKPKMIKDKFNDLTHAF